IGREGWRTLSGGQWRDWQRGWRTLSGGQWRDWQREVEDTDGGQWRDWQRGGVAADTERLVRWRTAFMRLEIACSGGSQGGREGLLSGGRERCCGEGASQ
ncbi:unnamed protein product, partial [Staurois parvus]